MTSDIEFGTDDQSDDSGAAPAAALECFQQYLFAIEDLATCADAIQGWSSGLPLSRAVEVANADWGIFAMLMSATPEDLVRLFSLPAPSDFMGPSRAEYEEMLQSWSGAAQDVGRFANRAAENGGQLANRRHLYAYVFWDAAGVSWAYLRQRAT